MKPETKAYIDSWMKKISFYQSDDLVTLFDKYSALYTLYNRLYNESYKIMKTTNKLDKPRYSDFEKATKLMVEYNSAEFIIDQLEKKENLQDLKLIAEFISKDIFHINLDNGVSKKEIDIMLMNNLISNNPTLKAQAIVSVIYNIRCNIQHGDKHFEENQRTLLEPLIRILETIVNLQIKQL